jgi:hypothetical protein
MPTAVIFVEAAISPQASEWTYNEILAKLLDPLYSVKRPGGAAVNRVPVSYNVKHVKLF